MHLDLYRKYRKDGYTIGILSVNGERFCETIEDKDRGLISTMPLSDISKIKVKGATAIPTGTYQVKITYSPRFCKNLPILEGVPGYEGIRIHSGNTAKDTEGCILPGRNTKVGMVTDSRHWTEKLIGIIKKALLKEKVDITIHW